MPQLLFFEENHQYVIGGIKIPSVSEVIAPLGGEISEDLEIAFEIAAERGTILHKFIELSLNDETEIEYPTEYSGYVDSIKLFLSEHHITPIAIERPVFHSQMLYAGTPDLVCEFDGDTAIIDYKFVSQIQKTKVKAQLNAYAKIYYHEGVDIDKLYAVQFLPDGNYRLYPVAIEEKEFDLCFELYTIKNKKHGRGKIN